MTANRAMVIPTEREAKQAWAQRILRQAEERAGVSVPAPLAPVPQVEPGLGVGLGRGSIVGVSGSTSLLLALVGAVLGEQEWVAIAGMPTLGVAALTEFGIDLDRVVFVPRPGAHGAAAVAALVDGFDVVVVGEGVSLTAGQRRSLLGRARRWRTTLFTPTWPEVPTRLVARPVGWEGLGRGRGYVRERRIAVNRPGHGGESVITLAPGAESTREQMRGLCRAG